MLAKVIISQDLETRKRLVNELITSNNLSLNHPDLLYLDDSEKLGVEATKKIRQHLNLKPYTAKGRGVVLESAHNLTLDAQNSLLKTLEEPPIESLIILGVDKEDSLLPTVLSRCEVVRIQSSEFKVQNQKWAKAIEDLRNSKIEERLTLIEKLEEKEEFLESLQLYFQQKLKKDPKYLKMNKLLLEAEEWQKANVNIRAILEYLMLELD